MAKKKRTEKHSRPSGFSLRWKEMEPERRLGVVRRVGWTLVVLSAIGATVFGLKRLEQYALGGQWAATAPKVRVVLVDPPEWMPASVVRRIEESLLPEGANFNAPSLAAEVYERAGREPWFGKVDFVRKRLSPDGRVGFVEVRAAVRQPIVRVQVGDARYRFVDSAGVVLPTAEVPRWVVSRSSGRKTYYCDARDIPSGYEAGLLHYIVVQGVRQLPPEPGVRWGGRDLADGLRLARLVLGRPYAREITVIDVSNYAHRLDRYTAELRMYAQRPGVGVTEIRFGRFPRNSGDYIVPTRRKMEHLDKYAESHDGRLAGFHKYLDLRYDELCLGKP